MADETRQLAAHAFGLRHGDIPAPVRALAVDNLVDQIGCQFGGSALPWSDQVRAVQSRIGGRPEASVLRYGGKLPVGAAAYVNSAFGHAFEYDDANPFFQGHPGVELIPPLLALAERDHRSGQDFLTAFLAGYEVRGRIGWAVTPEMSQHGGPQFSTSAGVFGAAAAAARLLGLDAEGIRNAMAIAGSYAGGLMQYDQGGGSVKRVHGSICAASGLMAAELAEAGMTGPEAILEGKRGFLKIFCAPAWRPERLVAEFHERWMIETVMFKPYSCAGVAHAAIDAVKLIVAETGLKPEDVARIRVGYNKRTVHHCAVANPHDVLSMQFSTAYALAIALIYGRNSPAEYVPATLADPRIRALAATVELYEDDALTQAYPGRVPARVTVLTRGGAAHDRLVVASKGTVGNRMTGAELDEKFLVQVEPVLGRQGASEALDRLRGIETTADLADLMAALTAIDPAA